MSDKQQALENIRNWFGVYGDAPKFDASVNTLLNLPLPEAAVREIVYGVWSIGYDVGWNDGYDDQANDGA